MSPDGTERLCRVLYGRSAQVQDYIGGSNAKMLHDAARRITEVQDKLYGYARAVLHGGSIGFDDAHKVLTDGGHWKKHDGEHMLANGTCVICGYRSTGADFLEAMDKAREAFHASLTPAEREEMRNEFIGPCVHGRDPWTRCDEGCDTEEQARGLKPTTPRIADVLAKLGAVQALVDDTSADAIPSFWRDQLVAILGGA